MGEEEKSLEGQEEKKPETPPADEQKEKQEEATPDGKTTDEGDIKDSHGQPGINKERHEKEMAAKDAKIKELEAKIDESAKTEKGREDLKAELDKVKAEMADERVNHKLELAGCRSIKAAKALLDDFNGDVSKLKTEHPYLFEKDKQIGRAGGKPGGAPNGMASKVDAVMGVKD